eukprot:TRINITY_DN105120_c0_g1_i1.p1 TRINITY_DN105120_c0_g1~~TRINITY_DN105120_c0_g1_i1.p1  ORF type:complete len:712 (+),score=147.81 TRINITY_DN105120_c0_g1_i1:31-2136(+)
MAPVGDDNSKLADYLEKDIRATVVKYDELWEVQDPEETPYRSKYLARELLEVSVKRLEELLAQEADEALADRGREMIARLFLFLGKNLYFCEEVPQAEKYFIRSLERYLRSPLRLNPEPFCYAQDVFNQLGMLWCNRQNHGESMNFLRRAQIMYVNRPQAVRESCEQRCENNYTLTMFYLAQAYGALQKPALSARFCAETMSRQLESNSAGQRTQEISEKDPFDCKDWVRNCCALSDFFVNECMFWTAEYLLYAAMVMCERCEEVAGVRPDNLDELKAECLRDTGNYYAARLKFSRTCAEKPDVWDEVWRGERRAKPAENVKHEGTKISFRCSADRVERPPEGGTGPICWDSVFPEVVYLEDEEAQDNRLAEEHSQADSGENIPRDANWLELRPGEHVRLPVHFRPLHEQTQRRIRRANAGFFTCRDPEPESGCDASSSSGSRPRQHSAAGLNFEAAREVFKLGNHFYGSSLETYVLDGWVTEHVRILQELSTMYRTLQFWEKDPKRSAAMLTRRARMLCPLLEQLSPKVYVAFWRQCSFSAAEIYQELYELKANGKMPGSHGLRAIADEEDEDAASIDVRKAARCNELARQSIKYYGIFIDSYHTDGKDAERVDTDHAHTYLLGRLNRCRMRTKMVGLNVDDELEMHKLAFREYEAILAYRDRNPEVLTEAVGMATELQLCEEMASMLPSKLARLAAKRR